MTTIKKTLKNVLSVMLVLTMIFNSSVSLKASAMTNELEVTLEQAIEDAIETVEKAAGEKETRSERMQHYVDMAITVISLATSVEKVELYLDTALQDVEDQKARDVATAEVRAACGENPSEAVTSLYEQFLEDIKFLTGEELVNVKEEYLENIKLEMAIEAAIETVEEAAGEKDTRTEDMQFYVDIAATVIAHANTVEEVAEYLETALKDVEYQKMRDEAIVEMEAACGENPSKEVKDLYAQFLKEVKLVIGEEINTLKVAYLEKITAQIEKEKPIGNTGDMAPITLMSTVMLASAAAFIELKRRTR